MIELGTGGIGGVFVGLQSDSVFDFG